MGSFLRVAAPYLFAALLGACSQTGDQLGRGLVAPGGYDFYDCPQLARRETDLVERDRVLSRLMDKAKQDGAGGRVVSAIAYELDYASNAAMLREVRRAQKERNCSPAPAAPTRRSDTIVR